MLRAAMTLCVSLFCFTLFALPVCSHAQEEDALTLVAEELGGSVVDGKWRVWEEKSNMGDKNNIFASLRNDEGIMEEGYARFLIAYVNSRIVAGFTFDEKFMADGPTQFGYTIDDQPMKKENWRAADKGIANLDGIPFLNSLVGRKKLIIQVYPDKGGSIELSFNIEGIENVLPPILNKCGGKDALTRFAEKLGGSVVDGKWVMIRGKSFMGFKNDIIDSVLTFMDFKDDINASLLTEHGLKNGDYSQFLMKCEDNEIMFGFGFPKKYIGMGRTKVEYCVDDRPMKQGKWLVIEDTITAPDSDLFLLNLRKGKRLVVRAYPADGSSMEERSFNIEGIETFLPLIQQECRRQ